MCAAAAQHHEEKEDPRRTWRGQVGGPSVLRVSPGLQGSCDTAWHAWLLAALVQALPEAPPEAICVVHLLPATPLKDLKACHSQAWGSKPSRHPDRPLQTSAVHLPSLGDRKGTARGLGTWPPRAKQVATGLPSVGCLCCCHACKGHRKLLRNRWPGHRNFLGSKGLCGRARPTKLATKYLGCDSSSSLTGVRCSSRLRARLLCNEADDDEHPEGVEKDLAGRSCSAPLNALDSL